MPNLQASDFTKKNIQKNIQKKCLANVDFDSHFGIDNFFTLWSPTLPKRLRKLLKILHIMFYDNINYRIIHKTAYFAHPRGILGTNHFYRRVQ